MDNQNHKTRRDLDDFAGIASDWFWETDTEHRFTYFSSRMEEVTKLDTNDLIGRKRTQIKAEGPTDAEWQAHVNELRDRRPFRDFKYLLTRPTDGSKLWVRIAGVPRFDSDGRFKGYRGVGHDITSEIEAMRRLEAMNADLAERNRQLDEVTSALEGSVFRDTLTKLPNRRAFVRDLEASIRHSTSEIALLHIDLDRFKWVNDTLGHQAGDAVLKASAQRLKSAIGQSGLAYRVGGDEFLAIMQEGVAREDIRNIASNITTKLAEPVAFGRQSPRVSASIGIAYSIHNEMSTQQLVSYADCALYEVKRNGRNGFCEITDSIKDQLNHRRELAMDLPQAIARREFTPFFQPQIDARSSAVTGVEVLVRWKHPKYGVLCPGEFLDSATELGLAGQIDRLMLEGAMATTNRMKKAGFTLPAISVNVSESRLLDPQLIDDIERLWTDRCCQLSIELLETIYFDEAHGEERHGQTIDELRHLGVSIEIDDFGSGRASLTALLKVWPDRLKLDRSLVQSVVVDPAKRAVVSAILEMARSLGIECIAEGVETTGDIDAMRALGCQSFQGYAIAHPLSEEELWDYLERHPIKPIQKTETTAQVGPSQYRNKIRNL